VWLVGGRVEREFRKKPPPVFPLRDGPANTNWAYYIPWPSSFRGHDAPSRPLDAKSTEDVDKKEPEACPLHGVCILLSLRVCGPLDNACGSCYLQRCL
jgi:hypothetical protein